MPVSRPTASRLLPLMLVFLAGCAGVTPIGDLLRDASRYDGKTVRIKGEVTRAAGAVVAGAYQVKDETGTLTVVSDRGSPPPEDSRVGVKGVFQSIVTLGSRSLAILKEESRFDP